MSFNEFTTNSGRRLRALAKRLAAAGIEFAAVNTPAIMCPPGSNLWSQ
jgi:hypothetical protein